MAETLSSYPQRSGYSGVMQTADASTIRVEGKRDGIKAIPLYVSSGSGDSIEIGAETDCDIVPDPAVATADQVKIG